LNNRSHPVEVVGGCGCLKLFATGWVVLTVALTSAAADVFTLDTNQSSLTVSGTVQGAAIAQQAPGSLTTKYAGTLQATQTGNTIQFPGLSLITALNSGNWQPLADGSAGLAPANYGASISLVAGFVKVKAALRLLQLGISSQNITVISNGQFAATNLMFLFPSNSASSLAYQETGLANGSGSTALIGQSTNNSPAFATLSTTGNLQVLTIPVNTQFIFSTASSNDTILNVVGQLVATAPTMPAVVPVLQPPTVQTQVVTLRWQAPAGQQFQVQSSTNFVTWQTNAVNVTSATTNYTWSGLDTAPRAFFRLAQ
jgi:hypothetical protein